MDLDKQPLNDSAENQTVFKDENTAVDNNEQGKEIETSTGLEQNMAGLLCYLVGFITGIIFLVIEKENRFVRFHAIQSIIVSVAIILLNTILALTVVGLALTLLIAPLGFLLWIFLMWKAYQGEMFKLPIVGDFALEQVEKSS